MQAFGRIRGVNLEQLELRRLLAADLWGRACAPASAENLEAAEVWIPGSQPSSLQEHMSGHDGHNFGCGCPICAGVIDSAFRWGAEGDGWASDGDGSAAEWDTGTPADITHVVTVQPIVVSNDNGSNTAEYFGNTTQQAIIHDLIDQVWAQAGIDIEWLAPNFWNSTFANVGDGWSTSRPTSDLNQIVREGDASGVGNSDPIVLDMYFVEIAAGFPELGENYANGLAFLGGNGSTLHIGDNLVSFTGGRQTIARVVAHEIGHNLGLAHTTDPPNLMDDGELLTASQISTSLASQYSVQLPENSAPEVVQAIANVTLDLGETPGSFDLATVFSDADGDSLTYQVTSSNLGLVTPSVVSGVLTLNFDEFQTGTSTITVSAQDARQESASFQFLVRVNGPTFSADFDGNGVDDLITWSNGNWQVALSPTSQSTWNTAGTWVNTVAWNNRGTGDFNGDGKADVVGRTGAQWWVGVSNGTSISTQLWGGWSDTVEWRDVKIADFNGDGFDDIAGREGGNWWIAVSTGTAFATQYWGSWSHTATWKDVSSGDFNGDGKYDLAGREGGNWWIAVSDGQRFNTQYWTSWLHTVTWEDVRVGDFNGDGMDDIAGRTSGNWWVSVSTGNALQNQYWGSWSTAVTWEQVRVGDFNNDGKDDILGRSGGAWWLNLGGTSFSTTLWSVWASDDWVTVNAGDFNGDGRTDLSAWYLDALWVHYSV